MTPPALFQHRGDVIQEIARNCCAVKGWGGVKHPFIIWKLTSVEAECMLDGYKYNNVKYIFIDLKLIPDLDTSYVYYQNSVQLCTSFRLNRVFANLA